MFKSDAVRKLQEAQVAARTRAYTALASDDDEARNQANIDYDETVEALLGLLGPDAHCADVDCDLYGFYSDAYKDRNGFRPSGHVTRADVQSWMEFHRDLPFDDDDDPCVGAEDFSLQGMVYDEPLPYERYDDAFYFKGKR
jgi:subtilisin family serine protease